MLSLALMAVLASTPKVGEEAPDFSTVDTEGNIYRLSELVKKGPVILAFFPKAFTSGCTRELSAYRDRYADVEKRKGKVLAISMDNADTLKEFKRHLKAPFSFIPDPEGQLIALYDLKQPVVSMAKRTTLVVGEGRKVLEVQTGADAINPDSALAACPLHHKQG